MTDINLSTFDLDLTGTSLNNLVQNEPHSLTRQRNVAVAPDNGPFYSESLVITHSETNYILRKDIDYKILQPYETLSLASGKQVAGIILIHNAIVHQNIKLKYQAVGGDFSTDSTSLENYLNTLKDDNPSYSWYNTLISESEEIANVAKQDKFDFHMLCYNLEKIRNSILWSDSKYYQKIREYLEKVLDSIEQQTKLALDSFLDSAFSKFKADINKALIGLNNIENLYTATTQEIQLAVDYETRIINYDANKYITLNALHVFKERVYERFVQSNETNIGLDRGVVLNPSFYSLIEMTNGSVFILESKKYYTDNNLVYDDRLYPPSTTVTNRYTVLKINNNSNNLGGLYIFSERSTKNLFLCYHPNGDDNYDFVWTELNTEVSTEKLAASISTHILNVNNPHQETKEKVGFPNLENLPVITMDEILCLCASRKYMTMDAFLLFFKTYLVTPEAAAQDPRNSDTEAVRIIYTAQAEPKCLPEPCPCPEPEPTPEPPAPAPTPYPLVIKISQQY